MVFFVNCFIESKTKVSNVFVLPYFSEKNDGTLKFVYKMAQE